MQAKLLKIKLNANSRPSLDKLLSYMKENAEFPRVEMAQKGYYWDSAFFETVEDIEYLYIVIKSTDFSTIMMDESELDSTPFREVYEAFRASCWSPEPYKDIEPLICFNSKMEFLKP